MLMDSYALRTVRSKKMKNEIQIPSLRVMYIK